MKYQHKGNFEKAIEELKKDCNNAVAQVYDSFNNQEGKLSQVIFTLKNNYAKKESISDGSSNILNNFVANYNATILNNVYGALKEEGKLFIEVRSIHDKIYGLGKKVGENAYIYNKKDIPLIGNFWLRTK